MPPDPTSTLHHDEEPDDLPSSEDEDFHPSDNDDAASDSEPDTTAPAASTHAPATHDAAPLGPIDHDEVDGLLHDAGTKKRKRGDSGADDGGLVQTRSMAAQQLAQAAKPLASVTGATIDVDAMWAALSGASLGPVRAAPTHATGHTAAAAAAASAPGDLPGNTAPAPEADDEMVDVTETYEFAGELHTQTKRVPKSSLGHDAAAPPPSAPPHQRLGPAGQVLHRPLRRVSAFDPNPQALVRGLPRPGAGGANGGETAAQAQARKDSKNKNKGPKHQYAIPRVKQPKKLNVVDKSKLDWQSHVATTGQRDELDRAQREKGAFLERRDFLERVEGRTEEQFAMAKAKGKA